MRISAEAVRRLAIERQGLVSQPRRVTSRALVDLVRALGCVQLDPISVVAPSHQVVLWSRLGNFDKRVLERVLWQERTLFHYWAHAASIVVTDDFPIHALAMRPWWRGRTGVWAERTKEWMESNASVRRGILAQLRRSGPLRTRDITPQVDASWRSSGWTNERSIGRMLDFLWLEGKVMIAGRAGTERIWDLADRWFPEWTPRERWSERKVVEQAALRAVRALGAATPQQIRRHFTRDRYPDLVVRLQRLAKSGLIEAVEVVKNGVTTRGPWWVHRDDAERLLALSEDGRWDGPTRILSPFDNLICDRDRTKLLWGFDYKIEIYVPKAKRKYGYYVYPVLVGDRLVGRLDLAVDKEAGTLNILAAHAEPDAPRGAGPSIAQELHRLARFAGAEEVVARGRVPSAWTGSLG